MFKLNPRFALPVSSFELGAEVSEASETSGPSETKESAPDDKPVLPGRNVIATFEGVPAMDTDTGEATTLDYFVNGRLREEGRRLVIEDLAVSPYRGSPENFLELDYRYRPGSRNTLGMAQGLAQRLHEAFPAAEVLELGGHRMTEGFVGKRDQKIEIALEG